MTRATDAPLVEVSGARWFSWQGTYVELMQGSGQTAALIKDMPAKKWSVKNLHISLEGQGTSGLKVETCGAGSIKGCDIEAVFAIAITGSDAVTVSGNTVVSKYKSLSIAAQGATASTNCVVTGNNVSESPTSNQHIDGTGHVIRSNIGMLSENRGTAAIADGASSTTVTHNLGNDKGAALDQWIPSSVIVTPRSNEAVWISARDKAAFTVSRAGTAGALAFDWIAES